MKKLYKYGILLLLPFLLFYLSRLTNRSFGDFYLSCVDPEYAYLFNGLCVAQLKLDLGLYYHPGTPLQCLIAITSIIANIGNRGFTLPESIFINPEYYLQASNLAINLINALFLFIIGYFIYERSRNIILALFIQASPFGSLLVLETMGRVIPESLLGITGLLLLLLVFYYSKKKGSNDNIAKYIILFSLISGYGLALKLTFIPLIMIPLIIIPSFVNKLKYLLYTLISFLIFAFPLLGKLDKFWRWIRNLFIHSGLFGAGEPNIINISDFVNNIRLLISQDKIFFMLLLLFVLVIILYFIKPLKLKMHNDIQYKVLIGIVLAIIIQYLIVAKHYKFTYMIPVLCFSIFGLFMAMEILLRPLQKFQITTILKNILYLLIIIFVVIHRYNKVMDYNHIRRQKIEKRKQTLHFIRNNLKEKTILLVPWYYGSAYVERGLVEGLFYSGKYKKEYGRLLKKHYPHTYFFLPWHNRYFDWKLKWEIELDLGKFIIKNKSIYIYFGVFDIDLMNKIFNDLKSFCPENSAEPIEIYSNNVTKESIYRFR
jgi:hypothetical protein